MFTGIIETLGTVREIIQAGTNKQFWISSSIAPELKVDQSVSHNGVCLTVEEIRDNTYRVTAIDETLSKTNLESWRVGELVNLERCLPINGRLDGHFIQGHVDTTGTCIQKTAKEGSWEFDILFPSQFAALVIEKGSICMNGVSLTAFNISTDSFRIAIIPYTYNHTNIRELKVNDQVNLEFDLIGKYILRAKELATENLPR